jgi:Peptidase M15
MMAQTIKLAGITQPQLVTAPIYLGSNFTWAEATHGGERLPQNTPYRGVIIPASTITTNIVRLARELDKIRSQFANRPITIHSWLRPPAVNKAVGGVSDSQHLLGWAADIEIAGVEPRAVAKILAKTWHGGLGDSVSFTHLDMRPTDDVASAARWDYGFA